MSISIELCKYDAVVEESVVFVGLHLPQAFLHAQVLVFEDGVILDHAAVLGLEFFVAL